MSVLEKAQKILLQKYRLFSSVFVVVGLNFYFLYFLFYIIGK